MASKMIVRAILAIVILSAVETHPRQRQKALEVVDDFQKPTEKQPTISWQKCQEEIGLNPVTISQCELPARYCLDGEPLCECAKRNAPRIKRNRERVKAREKYWGKNENCHLTKTLQFCWDANGNEVTGEKCNRDKKTAEVTTDVFCYESGDEAVEAYTDCLRDRGKIVVDSLQKEVNERISQAKTCEKNAATLLVGRARCQWKNFIGREDRQNKMNDANLFCKCLELEVGPQKAFLVRASHLKDNTGKHGRRRTEAGFIKLVASPRSGSASD